MILCDINLNIGIFNLVNLEHIEQKPPWKSEPISQDQEIEEYVSLVIWPENCFHLCA